MAETVTVAQVLGGAVAELDARPTMAAATRVRILDAVGQTYRGLGMVRENVEIAERASGLWRAAELGVDHPETLRSTNNLALAYLDATRFDRAIPLLERTTWSCRRPAGRGPSRVGSARSSSLALAYTEAGQPDRAIPLQERALAGQRAELDDGSPRRAHLDEQPRAGLQARAPARSRHPALRADPRDDAGPAGQRTTSGRSAR